MEKNHSWEQLAKYFAGELSAEEDQQMESWIKADPKRKMRANRLYEIWKESEIPPYRLDVDEAWQRLSGDMDKIDTGAKTIPPIPAHSNEMPGAKPRETYSYSGKNVGTRGSAARRLAIAGAAAAIIVIAGLFTYYFNFEAANETEKRVFVTQNGERASYLLSDGTKVMLHAGSRLEIPEDFKTGKRELFLEGEAYFEVAHDPESPFIVHSEYSYTRVVGTRFLVLAWPNSEHTVEVVVSEGKVLFGGNSVPGKEERQETFISEYQKGTLTIDKGPVVTDVKDLGWYLGWTEGRLVFEDRPLREVLPRLERWYAIDIQVKDEHIRQKKITAEIDYSQSMYEVLQGIALTLGLELEVEKENRTVTFRASGEPSGH